MVSEYLILNYSYSYSIDFTIMAISYWLG